MEQFIESADFSTPTASGVKSGTKAPPSARRASARPAKSNRPACLRWLLSIQAAAEAAAANLRELRGCEIDRDSMIEQFERVEEQAMLGIGYRSDAPTLPAHSSLRWLVRIQAVAEGAAANLRELRGCEIDRDSMIELFELINEQAAAAMGSDA